MSSLRLRELRSIKIPFYDNVERKQSEWRRQSRFWNFLKDAKNEQRISHRSTDLRLYDVARHNAPPLARSTKEVKWLSVQVAQETARRLAEDAENDPDGSEPLDLYVGEDQLWMQQVLPAWVTFDNIYEGMAAGNQQEGGRKELYQRRIFYLRAMRRMDEMFWKCLFSREQQRRKRELAAERALERRAAPAAEVKRSPVPTRESAGVAKAKAKANASGRRRSERIAAMKN